MVESGIKENLPRAREAESGGKTRRRLALAGGSRPTAASVASREPWGGVTMVPPGSICESRLYLQQVAAVHSLRRWLRSYEVLFYPVTSCTGPGGETGQDEGGKKIRQRKMKGQELALSPEYLELGCPFNIRPRPPRGPTFADSIYTAIHQ
jgi:hypothetical protein